MEEINLNEKKFVGKKVELPHDAQFVLEKLLELAGWMSRAQLLSKLTSIENDHNRADQAIKELIDDGIIKWTKINENEWYAIVVD